MVNRVLQSWENPSATCILEKESILNGGGIKGGGFSKFAIISRKCIANVLSRIVARNHGRAKWFTLRPDSTTAKFFVRNCACEIRMVAHDSWAILLNFSAFALSRTDFYIITTVKHAIWLVNNRAGSGYPARGIKMPSRDSQNVIVSL